MLPLKEIRYFCKTTGYLAVEASNMTADTTFAIRQCSFKKNDVFITMMNPGDAEEPMCTNDLIDLYFKYETDENGIIRALFSHRLFVLGRGNTDNYQLSCDVTVCDSNNEVCELLRDQCEGEHASPEMSETGVDVQVETDVMWTEEHDDPSSEAYTSLAANVSFAVAASFDDSASKGYVLTGVDVTFAHNENSSVSTPFRRKRDADHVIANTQLTFQHDGTASDLTAHVDTKLASSPSLSAAGFSAIGFSVISAGPANPGKSLTYGQNCGKYPGINRIINGQEASLTEHPFQVKLKLCAANCDTYTICGGVIIGERHVVSAAHCTYRHGVKPEHSRVFNGFEQVALHGFSSHCTYAECGGVLIASWTQHPNFNFPSNDIVVIVTETSLQFSEKTYPACLPSRDFCLNAGTPTTVSGYGYMNPDATNLATGRAYQ